MPFRVVVASPAPCFYEITVFAGSSGLLRGMFSSRCQKALHTSNCKMHPDHAEYCGICGAIGSFASVCPDCEKSFESVASDRFDFDEAILDPEKYTCRMFPWEPAKWQPALINSNWAWFILAVGLALIVILLALFRTPLPSCWEISS